MIAIGIAAIFRISSHSCAEVTRHVDFRDNLDVTRLGIGNHVLNFFLCIEVRTIGLVNPILCAFLHIRESAIRSDRTYRGELRIFFDFYAPTLVIAKVPVEGIHLVSSHYINHALHFVHCEEVARYVEHKTAIVKARLVGDVYHGQSVSSDFSILYASHYVGREHFLYTLKSVEKTQCALTLHFYLVGSNV